MSNPRLFTDQANLLGPEIPVAFDSTIDLPVFANGANLSVSKDIHNLVTNVTTSTYAAPADNITVGKGVTNQRVFGQIVTAEFDGFGTVQTRGIIKAPVNASNPPALNQFVAVDGNGKAVAAGLNAQFSNAVCIGYVTDSNDLAFTHLQGNISVPTTVQTGPTVCLVALSGN